MDIRFDKKVVVVTGGSSGIGEVTAKAFVKDGATVIFAGTRELTDAALEGYGGAEYYKLDVSKEEEVSAFAAYVDERYGGVDILVNNAGINARGNVIDCPTEVWNKVMNVNVTSVFLCCKYFLPQMIKKGKGAVVNISSVCGFAADYDFAAYNASKGAIVNLTRNLALDFAKHNIRVNAVAPAQIRTPMYFRGGERLGGLDIMDACAKDAYPMERAGEPEEIAACVLFLASDFASFVTGHNLVADGGVLAHTGNPHQYDRIIKEMRPGK
jgi:meso-butanediol dehydrogenase/(S,S)-butanediol dehydrogenase/diacetyl reductase